MKSRFKLNIITLLLISITSCENDKDPVVSADGFELRNDLTIASPPTLLEINNAVVFGKYNWDACNNGVASVSTYKLVIFDHDADLELKNPVEYQGQGLEITPDSRKGTITVNEMNEMINNLKSFKCGQMNIDLRIKSTLGTNPNDAFIQYSNPVNFKVTGYSKSTPILSFVKDGNTAATEPILLSSGYLSNSDYEAYLYLRSGSYKFVRPDACGSYATPTLLGGTGTLAAGIIDLSTSPASIVIPTTGHYQIKANLATNTYSIKEYRTFGIFGSGVRISGTANATPMLDNNDNIWKITIDLIKGQTYRFKSNLWFGDAKTPDPITVGGVIVQLPPFIPPTSNSTPSIPSTTISILGKSAIAGQLEEVSGSTSLFIVPGTVGTAADRQKYEIVLDVSSPRKYTYTITPK